MAVRSRVVLAAVLVVAVMTSGVACGRGGGGGEGSSACDRFAVFDDEAWKLRSSHDAPADLELARRGEPSMVWYSELERSRPDPSGAGTVGTSLRISGHEVGVDELRRELPGIELRPQEGDPTLYGRDAFASEPSIVVRAVDPGYSRMLLSYGLRLDELIDVEARTRTVCGDEFEALSPSGD